MQGGPGGMGTIAVLERCDADKNGRLDADERKAARAWLKENRPQRGRGPGGPGGFARGPGGPPPQEEVQRDNGASKNGAKVVPADVATYANRPLFDADIVRTFFFEFPQQDWFEELSDFYRTDVEVPATVTVDGVTYRDVGTSFRGNTSYMMAPGRKKSLDLAFDFVDGKQNLYGVRNLDLLNCHTDASYLREALHGHIANKFFPAPRVCLVRVVINGEDHGLYAAVQAFDKTFLQDHFGTTKGDRFKVPPDFSGNGGLRWLGDDPQAYKRNYQLKSNDNDAAWRGLVDMCAVLERTATEDLERILPQHLDVDGMLWFLAVDNALGDDDGYHSRASDYSLYRDPHGRFHAIPRDNNEVLLGARGGPRGGDPGGPGGGPGGFGGPAPDGPPGAGPRGGVAGPGAAPGGRRGGPGPGGAVTSPLQMASRADRPLLRRLLEVPVWRQRYLANLRELATTAMSPDVIGARIDQWQKLLEPLAKADVHSLHGYDAFSRSFAKDETGKPAPRSLMAIIAQRRAQILEDASMQGQWPELAEPTTTAHLAQDGTYTLAISCRVAGSKVAAVLLNSDRGAFGHFTVEQMHDDGAHGDGSGGDGVYGALLPAIAPGETWRFWIEATAADTGHVDCQPAGNGAKPFRWTAPKIKAGKRN